jgi:PAS domain S-box-containing protein
MGTVKSGIASMSSDKLPLPPLADYCDLDSPHAVQLYSDDGFLLDALSRFIGSALASGDAAVVIATAEHRQKLADRLKERGLDPAVALRQGRYVELDAAETLSKFMRERWPEVSRFTRLIGGVIEQARAAAGGKDRRVAAFGEMVALLAEEGKIEAAIRLEQLWNDLAQTHRFYLRCAYSISSFARPEQGEALFRICREHTHVIPAESFAELNNDEERVRHIALLQQKAQALETEIAERKLAEKATRTLAAIVESCDDAIVSKDLNGIVTSWNASAERIFGYRAEEMIGQPIIRIIPPELQDDEKRILEKIRRGERIEHFETVRLSKSGRRIEVSLTISPVKDDSGRVIGAAKVARDISDRKRTDEQLRRAEKLAAAGQLAASIAHEINNPMQALTNLLSLIGYRSSLDEDTRQLVTLADAELIRMSHITRQMLSFYRQSSVPVPVKVTEVMEDVLELFLMRMRSNDIKLRRQYEFAGEIQAFPTELRQLFANLVSNAVEAIGHGGQIQVHIAPARDWGAPERTGVRVVVADNGPGIQGELRSRIFDAFVTTKDEKGTGLGLWVVRGIVTKHGGFIRMRSSTRPKRSGTVFSVFLPIDAAAQMVPPMAAVNGHQAA